MADEETSRLIAELKRRGNAENVLAVAQACLDLYISMLPTCPYCKHPAAWHGTGHPQYAADIHVCMPAATVVERTKRGSMAVRRSPQAKKGCPCRKNPNPKT